VTPPAAELPILLCHDASAWEQWLGSRHSSSDGVWLKFAKKGAPTSSVTHAEALEHALCFGWIDGQVRPLDEHFFLQRFTPRRARSRWSQINRRHAERLMADGRMRQAGLDQVEAARKDGRWQRAYEPQSTATVPADLQEALDANPAAKEFFQTLRGSNRYAILYRVNDAKRPETRARRIAQYVRMCAEHRTLH
jgi:uncharacterized protein YdeI (YjbR/CyaY-like superfamily)